VYFSKMQMVISNGYLNNGNEVEKGQKNSGTAETVPLEIDGIF